jgi:hypothetical protein
MERFRYDRSSKWLIEHHGDSILRLAGIDDVVAWKPLPAEVVQPRQIPDGLLEVERRGRPGPDLFLIEIETYADRQIADQIMDDLMLVFQARRVVPEVVLLVLRPKGQVQVVGACEVASPSKQTRITAQWPVVELWKVPADPMLALHEPGLVPWIPLMESAQPPEKLLLECRGIIDQQARPDEVGNLLVVAQVLAGLRYNDRWLFDIFGGKRAMIESPYLKEIIDEQMALKAPELMAKGQAEGVRRSIVHILKKRFADVPADIVAALQKIDDGAELDRLTDSALACTDLDAFRQGLRK